jgi:hypothetical protein
MPVCCFARAVVLMPILVLAVAGMAGCGSGDSAGSTSEEDRVKQVFDDWQHAFGTGDGQATCSRLTLSGRRELLEYRRISGYIDRDATCEEVVRQIVEATDRNGVVQQPAKAISARVDGDRAVAQVVDGGRPPRPVLMVKRGGRWMFPTAGFGSLVGGEDDGR